MKEEKPRKWVEIGSCRHIFPAYFAGIFFHLTASHHSHNILTSNILPKSHLRLGTSESTQRQPPILQLIDYQTLQKQSDGYGVGNTVARGGKTCGGKTLWRKNPVEAKPRQVALLAALLTSGFRNGAESQKYPHRSAFLSNFI